MNKQKNIKSTGAKDTTAEVISAQSLNIEAPEKNKSSSDDVAIYVRSLLQNWRQGTVSCKGRSEVAYSNKKPWKQKGTGRARAGSARSPLWRGGGVIFGPQPRTRTLKASTQVKRNALRSIFFDFLGNGRVVSLDWTAPMEKPRTALAFNALQNVGLHNEKLTLFLPMDDALSRASFANIPQVQVLYFDQPNAYDLANCKRWVFFKKDAENFKKMVSQWI